MDPPLAAFPSWFLKIAYERRDKDRMRNEDQAPDIYDHAALYDRSQACRTYTSEYAEHRAGNQHFKYRSQYRCNVVAASYP